MNGHRTRIVAVALLTAAGLVTAEGWEAAALGDVGVDAYANSPMVGMNIAGLSNYSTQWTLGNYYLSTSNSWAGNGTVNSSGDPTLNYPGQTLGQYVVAPQSTTASNPDTSDYPAGTWTVTWDGTGSMDINGATPQNYFWESGSNGGSETFSVSPGTGGLYLTAGYNSFATGSQTISNIHVYAPGYAPGQPNAGQMFTTQFTQGLKAFGTVRYMDAMNTNNDSTYWSGLPNQTTEMSNETWTGADGMPVAAMVAMANQTNTNPWFCMPENASPAYVTQFAQYVDQHLDSNLKVYVEYGNEDWNPNNPAYKTVFPQQMANDGVTSWTTQWANDAAADFQAWESVFTSGTTESTSSQIIRVASIQSSTDATTTAFLAALGKGNFDTVADAPYFGPTAANMASYATSTLSTAALAQAILNDMKANIEAQAGPTGDWTLDMQLAQSYGVPLIGYEGGQGLVPPIGADWYDAYVAAEENPEMEQIYQQWLEAYLDQVGASEVNAYNYVTPITDSGAYGTMEYQGETDAPKYDGLLDFITGVPEPATLGLIAPAVLLLLTRRRRA